MYNKEDKVRIKKKKDLTKNTSAFAKECAGEVVTITSVKDSYYICKKDNKSYQVFDEDIECKVSPE